MKRRHLIFAFATVLVLMLSLFPAAAMADNDDPEDLVEELTEKAVTNLSGETMYNPADGYVYNDGGIVFNNGGVVYNNGGTVYNNNGIVFNNGGTVYNNLGSVYNNAGEVINNGGMVYGSDMVPAMDEEDFSPEVDEEAEIETPSWQHSVAFAEDYSAFADIEGLTKENGALFLKEGDVFTIRPKEGYVLCAAESESGTWAFNEDGSYTLSDIEGDVCLSLGFLHIEMPRFDSVSEGYGLQKPQGILVENPSGTDVRIKNVKLSGDDEDVFDLSRSAGAKIKAGETVDNFWTVCPEIGFEKGTYTALVTVEFKNGSRYQAEISFMVK